MVALEDGVLAMSYPKFLVEVGNGASKTFPSVRGGYDIPADLPVASMSSYPSFPVQYNESITSTLESSIHLYIIGRQNEAIITKGLTLTRGVPHPPLRGVG